MTVQNHARFQLHPRESVRDGIGRIATALADSTQRPDSGDPAHLHKAVHETRLALKRTRALVRLLRPTLGSSVANRLNHRLRTASQRLAEARDAAEGLRLLDELGPKRSAADRAILASVRTRFAKSVSDPKHSSTQLSRGLAGSRSALRSTVLALNKAPWKQQGWAAIASGLEQGHRRARKRFRSARKSEKAADFHAWRTASKSLLYQLALVRPIGTRRLERFLEDLDGLQAALGQANDVSTLAQRLTKNPGSLGTKPAVRRTLEILGLREAALRKDTLKRGRRLFDERSPEFIERLAREWKAWRRTKTKAP